MSYKEKVEAYCAEMRALKTMLLTKTSYDILMPIKQRQEALATQGATRAYDLIQDFTDEERDEFMTENYSEYLQLCNLIMAYADGDTISVDALPDYLNLLDE